MSEGFSPKINLFDRMEPTKLNSQTGLPSMRLNSIEQPETTNFKTVFSGLVENLDASVKAPDQLMKDFMSDKADIHEVIGAMSQAEINVNIATTATTKVLQAYEKIMQIQI